MGCAPKKLVSGVEGGDKLPVTLNATDQTITFTGAGGIKLEGSLMVPAGSLDHKHPAVLLISGSGPTDRDGNQPGLKTDTLKQIATGLAGAGIASFRFDKRAVATNAKQWPKSPNDFGPFFSWKNHIGDAMAAWFAMKKSGLIDSTNCAILGHSEGGLIALVMAQGARPVALVLAGTPARRFDVLIHEQLSKQLALAGETGKKLLATSDRISAQIRTTGRVPLDVPTELKALYNPSIGVYFKEIAEVDPLEIARRFPGPVLVVNGNLDKQVNPKLDAEALFNVLKSRQGSHLTLVPLASHNLKPVTNESDLGLEGDVVPDAIEAIQLFLIPLIGGKSPDGLSDLR